MDNFEVRKQAALQILANTGMQRNTYAPGFHRLLWRLGVKIRPPHFMNPVSRFAFFMFAYGIAMFVALSLFAKIKYSSRLTPVLEAKLLLLCLSGGLLFSAALSLFITYGRWKFKLPSWNNVL